MAEAAAQSAELTVEPPRRRVDALALLRRESQRHLLAPRMPWALLRRRRRNAGQALVQEVEGQEDLRPSKRPRPAAGDGEPEAPPGSA